MPELPEVTTTVNGLNRVLPGLKITDVWSDYFLRTTHKSKNSIKNKKYFENFASKIRGTKIIKADRIGKNVLIRLSEEKTVLLHMKMTGHLLYGKYEKKISREKTVSKRMEQRIEWVPVEPEELKDPFNRFIHLVFSLSNGKQLAFSDMRKFANVQLLNTSETEDLAARNLGPDPLKISLPDFLGRFSAKKSLKIKAGLMDQTVLSGIGNIYSDEILWETGIHPERKVGSLSKPEFKKIWSAGKKILKKGIRLGGDSMSDYRNIEGKKGHFQKSHKAYRRTGQRCQKGGCEGMIVRKKIGGRSAHFCNKHQK